jgi:hypothetical protein
MFTESNTVESLIRDLLCGTQPARWAGNVPGTPPMILG